MHLTNMIISHFRYFLLLIRIGYIGVRVQRFGLIARLLIIKPTKFLGNVGQESSSFKKYGLAKPMFIILNAINLHREKKSFVCCLL